MKKLLKILFQVLLFPTPWFIRRPLLNIVFGYEINKKAKIGISILLADKAVLESGSLITHFTFVNDINLLHMKAYSKIGRSNWITGANTRSKMFKDSKRKCEFIIGEHGLALAWLAWSSRTLGAARENWIEADSDEGPFYLTPSLGPGVLGVIRQRILLPQWTLGLEPEERDLIWTHEAEHVRAGDNRLLAAVLALLVAVPWVLPLWWQFRRLEVACELDCDRRVLERCGVREGYGELLIRVASGSTLLPISSFSLGRSSLERRVRSLVRADGKTSAGRSLRIAASVVLLFGFLISALAVPVPATGTNWSLTRLPSESVAETFKLPQQAYDEYPKLLNRAEVQEAFHRRYPSDLQRRDVEGTVGVLIHIDGRGTVDQVRMQAPSPHDRLNRLVKEVSYQRRYRPAQRDGAPVKNWFYLSIEYPPTE